MISFQPFSYCQLCIWIICYALSTTPLLVYLLPISVPTNHWWRTGHIPGSVSRSNLILVPKSDEPVKVMDYRPISVCNTIYKIISKVLALRIRPIIPHLISNTQAAFIPEREITENTILFREILHSFNSSSYANYEFSLKADLSKFFDIMDWDS